MISKKGFTLIELLVVIAIIGILASIVLVSLGGARGRARDARIMAGMNQIRSTGEIYLGNVGNYTGLCTFGDITTLQADITSTTGGNGTNFLCNPSAGAYCVEVQMNAANAWWCVDHTLRSQQYGANPTCVGGVTPVYTCQ